MERTTRKPIGFNILCCDPSLTAFGFVVMKGNRILHAGCIKTTPSGKKMRIRKGDDRMRRVSEINNVLKEVIHAYQINYIVSELPHGSQSAVAATALGIVSAMVQTISDFMEIGIEWYSEADSKKCALGKQSAAKQEMIDRMKQLYVVEWTGVQYRDEAVADALAVHYVARSLSSVVKLMK